MSRAWTVVIRGDWHLPHLVNMLAAYRGNGEQNECRDEVIEQVEAQMIPAADGGAMTTRPLALIDPEDREQVERLIRLFFGHLRNGDAEYVIKVGGIESMQKALREFADPKPVEVFEHFVVSEPDAGVPHRSACGKVWTPSDNTVADLRCPVCVEIVDKGWTK